jgi:hypothetical protein
MARSSPSKKRHIANQNRRSPEAGIQDVGGAAKESALLVSDAPEAGHPSEGALLRLNRSICKAIQRGRLQALPSASI